MVRLSKVLLVGCLGPFSLMVQAMMWSFGRPGFSLGLDLVLHAMDNLRASTGVAEYSTCLRHVGSKKLVKRGFRVVDDEVEYRARRRDYWLWRKWWKVGGFEVDGGPPRHGNGTVSLPALAVSGKVLASMLTFPLHYWFLWQEILDE